MPENAESSEARFLTFLVKLVEIPYVEVSNFRAVFDENLPYTTKHGVKGDEFDNVIVMLDDPGANWNQYSFGKLLSGADTSEARLKRTRNLFYVCCSRARVNLAVVNLAPMGDAAGKIEYLFGKDFVASV
jgi:DNA helicase-2/ATP-dependent DNA helicase PcrA